MAKDRKDTKQTKRGRKIAAIIVLLLILILLLLVFFGSGLRDGRFGSIPFLRAIAEWIADTSSSTFDADRDGSNAHREAEQRRLDSLRNARIADSLARAKRQADSLASLKEQGESNDGGVSERERRAREREAVRIADSIRAAQRVWDSLARIADSLEALRADPCYQDTMAPWIYPDPSGGMHRRHVAVRLLSVEHCKIQWKFKGEAVWHDYAGQPISVTSDTTLLFTGTDSCGNKLEPRQETYVIRRPLEHKKCPDDMEYIKIGETQFCIDRYEWPNKKGAKPQAYISVYHAADSCFTAGKRLCSSEEWSLACGGAYGWKYPYGNTYEPRACNTRDTTAIASGKKVECRGFFDVYDMAGNLAEWTSSRSKRNRKFHDVMGGFWESGPQSRCFEKRYSYYPQNRHNPVGFRCCKDCLNK